MSVRSFIKGTKTLQDLTHVTGAIKNERYIKHLNPGNRFRKSYYEDIFVLSIQNCNDEFGFVTTDQNTIDLTKVRYFGGNTIADIYYDKFARKIEGNITLHTFDLKIDDVSYIKIEDILKTEKIACIFFSFISVVLCVLTFFGIKSAIKQVTK
jgi:hypothetical protein